MINKINKWKEFQNLDSELKSELFAMTDAELSDAFYTDLEFGTGGMRGILGPGSNRMNIYTIMKANYGYGKYILRLPQKLHSVVIAYDCRRNSVRFAKTSAQVLASMGIKVYLFTKITPTPQLSFAVRYLKAGGGIVVTASHNPPNYNGYKIYDQNGCQLVPDLAQIVIDEIAVAPDPFTYDLPTISELVENGMIQYLDELIDDEYLAKVKSIKVQKELNKDDFKIVFTPLHGTSAYLGQKMLKEEGYNVIPVKEQMVADSNFSTVALPNPEDPKAFELAIKYAKENDADVCIATDPDADRVGLAVKHQGDFRLLTGNQTGAILIYYLATQREIKPNSVLFNTIVTSPLGAVIAKSFGIDVVSTLTGFKFIGEQAELISKEGKNFFFGYEESYGYVVADFVRDKDSLQALLLCSEVSCFYKKQGKTLVDVLNEIYDKYGYYHEDLVNIALAGESGAKTIAKILDYFRNNVTTELGDMKFISKEDYKLSTIIKNGKTSQLTLPKSNVLKYTLLDGSWFVLRPSGTEPKMKVYVSTNASSLESAKLVAKTIKDAVLAVVEELK